MQRKTVHIALIGCGTVGSGVAKILTQEAREIERRTGLKLVLRHVVVRSASKKRPVRLPRGVVSTDVARAITDPSVDIVVELIGGLKPAGEIVAKALAAGKHVVTANKALLAERGNEIFSLAARHRRRLGLEAAVCGGIPIIKSVREGLASNRIHSFFGIVNGTCNYILTAMSQSGQDFSSALSDAQKKGYAEKNPGLDIDGVDSAHKLAVLARLAFGSPIPFKQVPVEGIRGLSAADISYAKDLGYVIKLLAVAKRTDSGLDLRVHPTMLPAEHPLASVRGVYNAVFVQADQAGDLLFYGRGAGMMPTASAVMADILDIAKELDSAPEAPAPEKAVRILPIGEVVSKYYLRFEVEDKPGVLGRIAQALGRHGISIMSVHQKEAHSPRSVPVIILTYEAREKDLKKALAEIRAGRYLRRPAVLVRVEK